MLVVRVHNLVPKRKWRKRYEQINSFERMLTDGHITNPVELAWRLWEKNPRLVMCWYDDYCWWGIASAKAYHPDFATFEQDTVYDQSDAEGFIKINALRLKLKAMTGRKRG